MQLRSWHVLLLLLNTAHHCRGGRWRRQAHAILGQQTPLAVSAHRHALAPVFGARQLAGSRRNRRLRIRCGALDMPGLAPNFGRTGLRGLVWVCGAVVL